MEIFPLFLPAEGKHGPCCQDSTSNLLLSMEVFNSGVSQHCRRPQFQTAVKTAPPGMKHLDDDSDFNYISRLPKFLPWRLFRAHHQELGVHWVLRSSRAMTTVATHSLMCPVVPLQSGHLQALQMDWKPRATARCGRRSTWVFTEFMCMITKLKTPRNQTPATSYLTSYSKLHRYLHR